MGSPDALQIDGLGGASSSTSKLETVTGSQRRGVDVEYLFAQVGVDVPTVCELAHGHGRRQCRYRGQPKAHLQRLRSWRAVS
jgi:PrpF protein